MFRMELWSPRFVNGERLALVDLPEGARTDPLAVETAKLAASETARQMLNRFGVEAKLHIIFIPDAMTASEIAEAREKVDEVIEAGGTLPSTDEVLANPDLQ